MIDGKEYYILCEFNGCKPWTKEAWEQRGTSVSWPEQIYHWAYDKLYLRGPGYDGVTPKRVHLHTDYPENIFENNVMNGINAGHLTYDATGRGYAAVVMEGHSYSLHNADPSVGIRTRVRGDNYKCEGNSLNLLEHTYQSHTITPTSR